MQQTFQVHPLIRTYWKPVWYSNLPARVCAELSQWLSLDKPLCLHRKGHTPSILQRTEASHSICLNSSLQQLEVSARRCVDTFCCHSSSPPVQNFTKSIYFPLATTRPLLRIVIYLRNQFPKYSFLEDTTEQQNSSWFWDSWPTVVIFYLIGTGNFDCIQPNFIQTE